MAQHAIHEHFDSNQFTIDANSNVTLNKINADLDISTNYVLAVTADTQEVIKPVYNENLLEDIAYISETGAIEVKQDSRLRIALSGSVDHSVNAATEIEFYVYKNTTQLGCIAMSSHLAIGIQTPFSGSMIIDAVNGDDIFIKVDDGLTETLTFKFIHLSINNV